MGLTTKQACDLLETTEQGNTEEERRVSPRTSNAQCPLVQEDDTVNESGMFQLASTLLN